MPTLSEIHKDPQKFPERVAANELIKASTRDNQLDLSALKGNITQLAQLRAKQEAEKPENSNADGEKRQTNRWVAAYNIAVRDALGLRNSAIPEFMKTALDHGMVCDAPKGVDFNNLKNTLVNAGVSCKKKGSGVGI